MPSPLRIVRRSIAIGLALSSFGLAGTTVAFAQSRTRRSRVKFTMPRLTYDRGAPSNRGDGASRNDFCGLPAGPIAITPQYSEASVNDSGNALQKSVVLTQTSEPRPTFALHLPLGQQDIADLRLNLFVEDRSGNPVYDLPITVPDQAGIITFKPGPSELPLQTGQRYSWTIEIEALCSNNGVDEPRFMALTGQIERQPFSPENFFTTPEEYAVIAAEQGFWSETMATVADLRRGDRRNEQYIADWDSLLEAIGLEALTTAPLSNSTQLLSSPGSGPANGLTNDTADTIAEPPRVSPRLFPVR